MKKRIFAQVMDKGSGFSFVFFLFFMMSFLPIIMLFFASLYQKNLPGIALALVFGAVLVKDMKQRKLFELCRDMAVLNLTLWFLLGFFTLIQGLTTGLPGILAYLLLVPYALISGYLVFFLLSRADRNREKVLRGGLAVSTMMAIISAINGAIMHALRAVSTQVEQLVLTNGTTPMVAQAIPRFQDPHLSFLLVLVLFNIPFVVYYLAKGNKHRGLWWYLLPVGVYALLTGVWNFLKSIMF